MKGKLIWEVDFYGLKIDDKIVGLSDDTTNNFLNYPHKLSLKNCKAIEYGYDLDEMADEWVFETNGHKWSNNDNTAGDNYASFKAGFQKALEILGDKKFSEEDVIKRMKNSYGIKYFSEHKMIENLKSLQQTEWDVEIVMEDKIALDGHTKIGVEPKLDADGCLILKRVE